MLRFTGEGSLYKTRNHYRQIAGENYISTIEMVAPQQFPNCEVRTMCTGVLLWQRDYCCRWDRTVFRSLWYLQGPCLGVWQDDEPDPCIPKW